MSHPVSQPVYPGAPAHQLPFKPVTVVRVDERVALVRDAYGKFMELRSDIMRAKGNLPAVGEQWIIDQQYGIWVFGAIFTGTIKGVEIPPENVTGLPEVLTATDNRITTVADNAYAETQQVRTDSLGQVIAKGDVLAATGPGTVIRQPAGTVGQVLVSDPAQPSGLAYRTPLALTAPATGATAVGRYVGVTTAGAPTTGTFATGDWITTQSGFRWTCTAGGTPGTWRSTENEAVTAIPRITTNEGAITALETRATNLETRAGKNEANGRHIWSFGGGSVLGRVLCSAYTLHSSVGIAAVAANGNIQLRREGRWSIYAKMDTDSGSAGRMDLELAFGSPNPIGIANSKLMSRQWRGSGYPGAGTLTQEISWTGWVTAAEMNVAITMWAGWDPATAGIGTDYTNYYLALNYHGPY
jgi:hypothetical protein